MPLSAGTPKKEKDEKSFQVRKVFQKATGFLLRYFPMAMIVVAAVYAVFFWKKYILNADWNEEQKEAYISEQSVLPFDEAKYKKALEIIRSRREKLESGEKYSGRDIFFPEGK